MAGSALDARVLVAVADGRLAVEQESGEATAAALREELGVDVVTKRGSMATEYLRDFGPTVDCIVCMSECVDCVDNLAEAAPSVPLVVFGDRAPSAPVDGIVARDGGRGMLAERVSDQIRRTRERDRLDEANTKLNALNAYTREVTGCERVDEVTDTVVRTVTEALGYERCIIGLYEAGEVVPYGNTFERDEEMRFERDRGVAGRTFMTGETHVVDDYPSDPDRIRDGEGVHSVVSAPIGDYGVLQVTAEERGAFDERDAEFVEIVGSHAREVLSRLQRESDLRVERDCLHAFFDGHPAPTAYVETRALGAPVLRDVNAAYEATFPDAGTGDSVESAFPTGTERRLYAEAIRGDGSVTERIERDTVDAENQPMELTIVPVRTAGLESAGYGVYLQQ